MTRAAVTLDLAAGGGARVDPDPRELRPSRGPRHRDAGVLLIGAVALGLGALLAASETLFAAVKWVGAAYLAVLGVMMLRSSGSLGALPDGSSRRSGSPGAIAGRSFLVTVTNPKGYLFFSAILPQFVDPALLHAPQYAALAGVFVAVDLLVQLAYATLGAQAPRVLTRRGAVWLNRLSGAALLALAGSLALYRRAAP